MDVVAVTIRCNSESKCKDLYDNLVKTYQILYPETLENGEAMIRNLTTRKVVEVVLRGPEAISSYKLLEKFMKWYKK